MTHDTYTMDEEENVEQALEMTPVILTMDSYFWQDPKTCGTLELMMKRYEEKQGEVEGEVEGNKEIEELGEDEQEKKDEQEKDGEKAEVEEKTGEKAEVEEKGGEKAEVQEKGGEKAEVQEKGDEKAEVEEKGDTDLMLVEYQIEEGNKAEEGENTEKVQEGQLEVNMDEITPDVCKIASSYMIDKPSFSLGISGISSDEDENREKKKDDKGKKKTDEEKKKDDEEKKKDDEEKKKDNEQKNKEDENKDDAEKMEKKEEGEKNMMEKKEEDKSLGKREVKIPETLKSPYINRLVNVIKTLTQTEQKIGKWLFALRADTQ